MCQFFLQFFPHLGCYRILSRLPSPFNFIVFCFCHPHQAVYTVHGQGLIRFCLFSARLHHPRLSSHNLYVTFPILIKRQEEKQKAKRLCMICFFFNAAPLPSHLLPISAHLSVPPSISPFSFFLSFYIYIHIFTHTYICVYFL